MSQIGLDPTDPFPTALSCLILGVVESQLGLFESGVTSEASIGGKFLSPHPMAKKITSTC